jgi:sterol desaturase/sphingolipid hydroxylase (fatty acid hydroxylase superfamily)
MLFGLEFVLPARAGHGTWGDPQVWNDVGHSIFGQGAGNAVGQALFVFAAALLAGEISARWGGNLWPSQWPFWVQVVVAIVVADGLDYWRHRLEHSNRWLWPIHALHHDLERMNVIKSSRGHFLDMFFRNLVVYAPLALVGAPREAMLAYAAAVTVFGPIAHANVRVPVPPFLYRCVLTPQVHHVHHARPLALSCSNYANVFPFWDVLFDTFEHPDAQPAFEYGVEQSTQPDGFLGQTLAPFADWRRMGPGAPLPSPRGSWRARQVR